MKKLITYFEYRSYLRDYYEERKSKDSFFSYRYMANRLEMDHSLLVKIITGKRHISDNSIELFSNFLKLNQKDRTYFITLVSFEKSRNESTRKKLFEKLLSLQSYSKITLQNDTYNYFQHWYNPAIRSLLDFYKYNGNDSELAQKLNPPITPLKVKSSIELLTRLNLIEKGDNGVYYRTEKNLSTGENWNSLAIRAYQEETIRLSADSLKHDEKEVRDISSVTMSIDKECFADIREILRECRETIIKRVNSIDGETDRLYQLNMQVIPLSLVSKESSNENK